MQEPKNPESILNEEKNSHTIIIKFRASQRKLKNNWIKPDITSLGLELRKALSGSALFKRTYRLQGYLLPTKDETVNMSFNFEDMRYQGWIKSSVLDTVFWIDDLPNLLAKKDISLKLHEYKETDGLSFVKLSLKSHPFWVTL